MSENAPTALPWRASQLVGKLGWACAFAALAIIVESGCGAPASTGGSSSPNTSHSSAFLQPNVSVEAIDVAGLDVAVAKHHGKVVLVDFWATGCEPCVKLFPHNAELKKKYSDRGLVMIAVSLNEPSEKADVVKFLQAQPVATEDYLAHDPKLKNTFQAFEIPTGIPCIKIYDRKGKLRETLGESAEKIDEAVNRLLDEP